MIEKYGNAHLDETLYYKRSSAGLDMYIVPKVGFSKTYAYFAVGYGGMHSEFLQEGKHVVMPDGMAHFLEHKLFESKEKNWFSQFHDTGASVNAYTNSASTVYYFHATEDFETNLKRLMGLVQELEITQEDVEKEKGIILEEIGMYRDQADWQLYHQTLRALYAKNPIRKRISGDDDDVKGIDLASLRLAYETFYAPRNCFVLVVGDVPVNETFETIEKAQTPSFKKRVFDLQWRDVVEPAGVKFDRLEVPFGISVKKSFIGYKDKVEGLKGRALHKHSLTSKLMNELFFGRASVLYNRLYQSGQINATFGLDYIFDKGYGFTLIGGDGHDPDAVVAATLVFGNELEDALKGGEGPIDLGDLEQQFERVRKKALGRYLMSFNGLEFIGHQYVTHITKGINPLDYVDLMNDIHLEDVIKRYLDHIVLAPRTIVSLVPK